MLPIKIAPSILSADFGKINEEIASIEEFCEYIHIDVMDGNFVPNITFGAPVFAKMKSKKIMDVHLMIANPEKYVEDFVKAGADIITVHIEACPHIHRNIQQIKELGVNVGVAINPGTPLEMLLPIIDDIDMALLMTVNPGFGGQKFIDSVLPKIQFLRDLQPELDIQVDGGINAETIYDVVEAGANVIVSGSYIFKSKNREKAIASLRV